MVRVEWGSADGAFPLADEHVVQLYRGEGELMASVAAYVGHVVQLPGQTFSLVATAEHWALFHAALRKHRINVDRHLAEGRIVHVPLDFFAPALEGAQASSAFRKVVGALLAQSEAAGRYRHIYVFGDLVNILLREGNPAAAQQLEELWEELRARAPFSLFCGYVLPAPAAGKGRMRVADIRLLPTPAGPLGARGVLVDLAAPDKESAQLLVSTLKQLRLT